jgi:hypothetical protein
MGCVWGILSELHALLGVSRFYCLFGDVDVSPVLETSVYICCVFGGFFAIIHPSGFIYGLLVRSLEVLPSSNFKVSVKT